MLEQNSQSRLETREGVLCIVVETPFSAGASEASSPGMRQWFRVEEPDANPAQVGGRPVRNIDPQEGLFIDEEGNSYRLAGGSHAEPFHAEVIPVEGGPGTRLKAGAALQSFLLSTGDDPEDEHANSRAVLGSERVITPEQVRGLQGLIEETGTELERVLAYYRVSALGEMTEGSDRRALDLLNRKLAKQSSQENGTHAQN
jgi:hypothetical protein